MRNLTSILAVLTSAALAALVGCASSSQSVSAIGQPARIRIVSYTSGQAFELVNESHTDRLELYSETRSNAATKVQTDEVVDEVLDYFDDLGLYDLATAGLAPPLGDTRYTRVIEIDTPGRQLHLGLDGTTSREDQVVFEKCFAGFLDVYNATYQLQSVDEHPSWSPRQSPQQ